MADLTTPNGCRWCGLPEREHYQRWKPPVGWHGWTAPTDAQRKERMLARRAAARAVNEAVDEAAAVAHCMACGTLGCRPGTSLCEPCLGRPYGTVGELATDIDECTECWGPRYVWYGNMWALPHREPGLDGCGHSCHEGDIWLAGNDDASVRART